MQRKGKSVISVIFAGALGKMGRIMVEGLSKADGISLEGCFDPRARDSAITAGGEALPLEASLSRLLDRLGGIPDVMVDFTRPDAAGPNAVEALRRGIRPVVGTTGIPPGQLEEIVKLCRDLGLAACVIPNFSIGVLALTRAALEAARWMKKAELVEMHHDEKVDAPSGTAKQIAERLASSLDGPVPIHSVRLPGMVATHEVIFGALGQALVLRHDTMSREAFLPGVIAAVRKVVALEGAVLTSLEEALED